MKAKGFRRFIHYIIVIALLISSVWTYLSYKTITHEDHGEDIILEITPDYQIISEKALRIWPEGTVFEQGLEAYFYAAGPKVRVTPVIRIEGLENGLLKGSIKSLVILQAVNDKGGIYWSYPLQEHRSEEFTISKDINSSSDVMEYTASEILLDVESAYLMAEQIAEELAFQTGLYQLLLQTEIKLSGNIDDDIIDKSILQTLPMELQPTNFRISRSEELISRVDLTNSRDTSGELSFIERLLVNPIPLIITIFLATIFLILILKDSKNRPEVAKMHKRYKEWITEGSVELRDRLMIDIHSLEGLVDLAIDLDKRVIYDSRLNKYYVLTEDIVYIYDYRRSNALMENRPQLGSLLLEHGLISEKQLETGLYYQQRMGNRLGESLMALGFIDEAILYSTLAAQQNIDYYEVDPKMEVMDLSWTGQISIKKALAMRALPIGRREDGRLVIACSETSNEGIKKELKEHFGSDIYLVAARPSAILEILERLDEKDKKHNSSNIIKASNELHPYERLSEEELRLFTTEYYRGVLRADILLKATGLINPITLLQAPKKETVINWLVIRNSLSSEYANLLKGLEEYIKGLDRRDRQEKRLPELLELLQSSNYLLPDTVEWCRQEQGLRSLNIEELLIKNYLVSKSTIESALQLISVLDRLLTAS